MNIYEKLSLIQEEMKVPKNQYNKFGGYSYRSAEDILETAKPVLKKHGAVLMIGDTVVSVDGRFYIQATARLFSVDAPEEMISVSALAREEDMQKGMTSSQLSGATSSYARKYCLNGLFLLDDNKDADTDAYQKIKNEASAEEGKAKIEAQEKADKKITKAEASDLKRMIEEMDAKTPVGERVGLICQQYGVDKLEDLKKSQYTHCINALSKGARK